MQNQVTTFQDALDTRFFAPLRRTRTRRIGVELEFPVWSRTPGTATDFAAVHAATDDFLSRFPFSAQVRDDEGNIYRATDPDTGDELSFDCSYNTLEISFGPDESLTKTHRRFTTYYTALQESLADVMGYLESTSIYCVERGERYINFAPVPLRDYLQLGSVVGEHWDGAAKIHRKCLISPQPSDVAWLRPFKFEDLTQRGTVEFRSVCEQPVREAFSSSAFHAGLAERVAKLSELLAGDTILYGHGYGAVELRSLMIRRDWPSFIDRKALSVQLHRILDVAEEGLVRRGFGEETLLAPLRRRADTLTSPAREHLTRLEGGESIESIAIDYGSTEEKRHA